MKHPEYISEIRVFKRTPRRFDVGGYLTIKRKKFYLRLADSVWFIKGGKFMVEKKWKLATGSVLDFNLYQVDKKLSKQAP